MEDLLGRERFCWKISNGIQIRKVILLNYQNNYVECSNQLLKSKFFGALFLRFQKNYFDSPTKLFLDVSNKIVFFMCKYIYITRKKKSLSYKKFVKATSLIHSYRCNFMKSCRKNKRNIFKKIFLDIFIKNLILNK